MERKREVIFWELQHNVKLRQAILDLISINGSQLVGRWTTGGSWNGHPTICLDGKWCLVEDKSVSLIKKWYSLHKRRQLLKQWLNGTPGDPVFTKDELDFLESL